MNWLDRRVERGSIFVPPGGPPQGPGPSREIYAAMGEQNIFLMCEAFYAELEKTPIRPLFGPDMKASSKRIASFLVGIVGGPPLYRQQYGEPEMRRRHLSFPIDEQARRIWLGAFMTILADAPARYAFPKEHLPGFVQFLEEFSAWMVNRAG